jgi:phage terminase large subunit GpA-like protein
MNGDKLRGGVPKKPKGINAADYINTDISHLPDPDRYTRIDTSPAIPRTQNLSTRIQEGKANKLETEFAKGELELRLRQDELVEKDVLGELVFGYLETLSNSMLSMPDGIIDNIIATVQASGRESRPRVVELLATEISKILEKSVKEQKVLFKKKRPCALNSHPWLLEKLECLTVKKVTITISEWAEQKRILPEGTPFPGFWRNDKTPYLVEIMDALSPSSPTSIVTIMKSVQMGLTAIAENFIGHMIDSKPAHLLYITATQDLAEDWARKRLDPMISLCGLGHKLKAETASVSRGRKASGDRALSKSFPGGSFNATSYNVAAMLRSNSFQNLIMDEVDAAPISTKREGDPVVLAKARTSAFEGRSKILIFSTPLIKQTSKVWASFKEGDQSYFNVPCPHCSAYQKLIWRDDDGAHRLHYDVKDGIVDSESVYYECKECRGKIKNFHKDEILPKGKWIAENLNGMPGHRSFHISGLYAPLGMTSWESLAQEWETAKGDNEKLKAFINLRLGEPWVDGVEFVDDEEALAKRQDYTKGVLPEGVEFCTMGCDVHGNDIQLEVLGFGGDGNHKWSIDYKKLEGSTLDPHSGAFFKLRNYIEKNVKRYNIKMVFIDAGYTTDKVIKFCSAGNSIIPIMGEGTIDKGRTPFKVRESKTTLGSFFVGIATDNYKEIVMKSLKLRHSIEGNFPYGFPFFPIDYDVKYFRGLNSEIKQPILNQGRLVRYQWTKIRDSNHPLDCRVYALCAKDFFFKRICESYEVDIIDEDIAWAAVRNGNF